MFIGVVPRGSLSDLTYSEKESLHGWYEKFKYYNCYPVVGKLIRPKAGVTYTPESLRPLNGSQEVPEGYADAPILLAIREKVGRGCPLYSPPAAGRCGWSDRVGVSCLCSPACLLL